MAQMNNDFSNESSFTIFSLRSNNESDSVAFMLRNSLNPLVVRVNAKGYLSIVTDHTHPIVQNCFLMVE